MYQFLQLFSRATTALLITGVAATFLTPLAREVPHPAHCHGQRAVVVDAIPLVSIANDVDDGSTVTPGVTVPNAVDNGFGWIARLEAPRHQVRVREELVLPSAPAIWEVGPDTRISDDGTTAITEMTLSGADGTLVNGWSLSEGDPAGEYTLRIIVDGVRVQEMTFLVTD